MDRVDAQVLDAIESRLLAPEVLKGAIARAIERLRPALKTLEAERERITAQRTAIEAELARLANALASGGELPTLLAAIREREDTRRQLQAREAALEMRGRVGSVDTPALEKALRQRASEWRQLLRGQVPQARQIVKKLLARPFRLEVREAQHATLVGAVSSAKLLGTLECAKSVASPDGTGHNLRQDIRLILPPAA